MTVSVCVQDILGFHVRAAGLSTVAHGGAEWRDRLGRVGLELFSKKQLVIHRGVTGAHLGDRVTVMPGNVRQTVNTLPTGSVRLPPTPLPDRGPPDPSGAPPPGKPLAEEASRKPGQWAVTARRRRGVLTSVDF